METTVLERLTKDLKVHLFHENFLSYTISYYVFNKETERFIDFGIIHFEFEYLPENLYNIRIQKDTEIYLRNEPDFLQWSDIEITKENFEEVLTNVFGKVNSDSNLETGIKLVNACYSF